ncbi:hypothetical protein NL676_030178 [Syzygium grande]|nr:hypothetical protein NL676_030178 [Syzygium grande]
MKAPDLPARLFMGTNQVSQRFKGCKLTGATKAPRCKGIEQKDRPGSEEEPQVVNTRNRNPKKPDLQSKLHEGTNQGSEQCKGRTFAGTTRLQNAEETIEWIVLEQKRSRG